MSCRSSVGRAFHTLGPAAEKLLSPKLMSPWNDTCSVTGRSQPTSSAVSDKLNVIRQVLRSLPRQRLVHQTADFEVAVLLLPKTCSYIIVDSHSGAREGVPGSQPTSKSSLRQRSASLCGSWCPCSCRNTSRFNFKTVTTKCFGC